MAWLSLLLFCGLLVTPAPSTAMQLRTLWLGALMAGGFALQHCLESEAVIRHAGRESIQGLAVHELVAKELDGARISFGSGLSCSGGGCNGKSGYCQRRYYSQPRLWSKHLEPFA